MTSINFLSLHVSDKDEPLVSTYPYQLTLHPLTHVTCCLWQIPCQDHQGCVIHWQCRELRAKAACKMMMMLATQLHQRNDIIQKQQKICTIVNPRYACAVRVTVVVLYVCVCVCPFSLFSRF